MIGLLAGVAVLLSAFHMVHREPLDFLLSQLVVYGAMALYFVVDAYFYLSKIKIRGALHEYNT
ncbi:hypothetical protein D3C78_1960330 [compost metagenome]